MFLSDFLHCTSPMTLLQMLWSHLIHHEVQGFVLVLSTYHGLLLVIHMPCSLVPLMYVLCCHSTNKVWLLWFTGGNILLPTHSAQPLILFYVRHPTGYFLPEYLLTFYSLIVCKPLFKCQENWVIFKKFFLFSASRNTLNTVTLLMVE